MENNTFTICDEGFVQFTTKEIKKLKRFNKVLVLSVVSVVSFVAYIFVQRNKEKKSKGE